jgi:hypothetical protein
MIKPQTVESLTLMIQHFKAHRDEHIQARIPKQGMDYATRTNEIENCIELQRQFLASLKECEAWRKRFPAHTYDLHDNVITPK